MRDALWITGNIAAATKDTQAVSADYLDLGAPGTRPDYKTSVGDLYACFQQTAAGNANDSLICQFETAADSSFSSGLETTSFPQTAVSIPAGKIFRYRVPAKMKRYVRLAVVPKSTGTFVAKTIKSWIELGPNEN